MDISAPRLENWVSAAPHLLHTQGRGGDKRSLVRELALRHPEASPDEIAAQCASWGIPVSGILVARIVQTVRAER
jgi:hypothetical protein